MVEEVDFPVAVTERDGVVDEPRVVDVLVNFRHIAPVLHVHGQHLVEELEQTRGEVLPHAGRLGRDSSLPLDEFVVVGVTERCLLPRETAREHTEEENTERPYVAGRVHVETGLVGRVADLGGSVRDTAAHARDVHACAKGHAEVDDLHGAAFLVGEHNVLWLDVSVHEVFAVHKFQPAGDLVDVDSGLALTETDFGLDRIKEIATTREILHHHVRGLGFVRGVVGSDDVRVLRQVLAILQLLLEARSGGGVFADGLDGHFTPVGLVLCDPGDAVCAVAGRLDEGVALIEASLVVAGISHCI